MAARSPEEPLARWAVHPRKVLATPGRCPWAGRMAGPSARWAPSAARNWDLNGNPRNYRANGSQAGTHYVIKPLDRREHLQRQRAD